MTRDLIDPALRQDRRAASEPLLCRVFCNDFYEIYVALYPGGLYGVLVHYKREGIRVMGPLGEGRTDPSWVNAAVAILSEGGRGPFHWVMANKLACGLQLTLHDRASMKMAGVEVPRSAGRYKDMFGENGEPKP